MLTKIELLLSTSLTHIVETRCTNNLMTMLLFGLCVLFAASFVKGNKLFVKYLLHRHSHTILSMHTCTLYITCLSDIVTCLSDIVKLLYICLLYILMLRVFFRIYTRPRWMRAHNKNGPISSQNILLYAWVLYPDKWYF